MKVKICGVTRPEDAKIAEEAGAAYVGTILVPESPRYVQVERAAEIAGSISLPLAVVLAGREASDVVSIAERTGARVIQLHGEETEEMVRELRGLSPLEIWKAVRIRDESDLRDAVERYAPWVDLLLLDSWHPKLLGGSGTRFRWEALEGAQLPAGLRVGVAGGLNPDNVAEAVTRLHPDLVDVGSGVEASPGIKDPDRIRNFVRKAVEAFSRERPTPADLQTFGSGRKE